MVRRIWPRLSGAFFIILILSIGCGKSPAISADEKEAFISTYVELTLAQIKFKNFDKQYQEIKKEIYLKNRTDEEFLKSFIDKISANIEVQEDIFREITGRLEKYEQVSPDSLNRYFKNFNQIP